MRRLITVVGCLMFGGLTYAQQPGPRVTRIEFAPATVEEGGGVFISLLGNGRCGYTIDYGDGTMDKRTAELPDRVQHVFAGDGEYMVVATPEAPCEGVARAKLDVRAINRGVWGLAAEAGPDGPNGGMVITIKGRGECVVTVDFGDGAIEKVSGTLPQTRNHRYERMGAYELKATAEPPCRGEAVLHLEIKK